MKYQVLYDPREGKYSYFVRYRRLLWWTSLKSETHPDQIAYFKSAEDAFKELVKFTNRRMVEKSFKIEVVRQGAVRIK